MGGFRFDHLEGKLWEAPDVRSGSIPSMGVLLSGQKRGEFFFCGFLVFYYLVIFAFPPNPNWFARTSGAIHLFLFCASIGQSVVEVIHFCSVSKSKFSSEWVGLFNGDSRSGGCVGSACSFHADRDAFSSADQNVPFLQNDDQINGFSSIMKSW